MIKTKVTVAVFFLILLLTSNDLFSQIAGCTDPKALNFNKEATVNDGSCKYEINNYYPEVIIDNLPGLINETSGLMFWEEGLWTHNDSGGKPELYNIDIRNNKIKQVITIRNAVNSDWEDITQDEDHIYISDLGNNSGTRKDLRILKIAKSALSGRGDSEVDAEVIAIEYADQKSFRFNPRNHDYDCEAIISYKDSLYVFSKNWADNKTKLYAISKTPGAYKVSPKDVFNVDGLVTGAALSPDMKEVTLIGYKDFVSFIVLLWDFQSDDFFSGNKRKIIFPDMVMVQTEGVEYQQNGIIWISAENSAVPQSLYRAETYYWTDPESNYPGYQLPDGFEFTTSFSEESKEYQFLFISLPTDKLKVEFYDRTWQRIDQDRMKFNYDLRNDILTIDTKSMMPGLYYVKFISGDKFVVRHFDVSK